MARINVKVDVGQGENVRIVNKTINVPDNFRFLDNHSLNQDQFEQLQGMPESNRGMAIVGQRSIQNPGGTMQSAATDYSLFLRSQGVNPQNFSQAAKEEYDKRIFAGNIGKFIPLRPAFHKADVEAQEMHQAGVGALGGAALFAGSLGAGGLAIGGTARGIGWLAARATGGKVAQAGVAKTIEGLAGLGFGGHFAHETYKHGGANITAPYRKGGVSSEGGLIGALTGGLYPGPDIPLPPSVAYAHNWLAGVTAPFLAGAGVAFGGKSLKDVVVPKKTIDPSMPAPGGSAGAEGEFHLQRWVNSLNKKMREMGIPGFQPKVEQGKHIPGASAYTNRRNPGTIYESTPNSGTPEIAAHEGFHLQQNLEALALLAAGKGSEIGQRITESAGEIGRLIPGIGKSLQENPLYKNKDPHTIQREAEAYAGGVYFSDFLRSKPRQTKLTPIGEIISKTIGTSESTTLEFMKWGARRQSQLVTTLKDIGMGGLKAYSKADLAIAKNQLVNTIKTGKEIGINVESLERRLEEIEHFQATGEVPKAEGPRRKRGEQRREPDFGKPYGFPGGEGGGGTAVLEAPPKVEETVKTKPQTEVKPQTQTKPETETEAPAKPEIEQKPETEAPAKPAEVKPEVKPESEVKPEVKPAIEPKVEPEVKPEVKPEVEPKVKPKKENKPEVEPEQKPKKGEEKAPEKEQVKPEVKPKVAEVPIARPRFGDSQQEDYGFLEMGGFWLPAAPSVHTGQWATPAYIIDSGRLEYNVD